MHCKLQAENVRRDLPRSTVAQAVRIFCTLQAQKQPTDRVNLYQQLRQQMPQLSADKAGALVLAWTLYLI